MLDFWVRKTKFKDLPKEDRYFCEIFLKYYKTYMLARFIFANIFATPCTLSMCMFFGSILFSNIKISALIFILCTLYLIFLIWIFKKFDDELGMFLENIFEKLYSHYITYGKAISEADLLIIKEKHENLHFYITNFKSQTHCYPVCYEILKILKKGHFLFIAVKNFEHQKVDNNNFFTMHALYVHDGWCYDTISGIQHPLDMILKHFQGKEYMYISYDDVKDLTYDEFREKYADGLNLWCKENDCYVSFCAD